jgi:site-specific recombinase XerC
MEISAQCQIQTNCWQGNRKIASLFLISYKHLIMDCDRLRAIHVVDGKGGKQCTSIFPKPILEALKGHLNGREEGYVFEGRDMGHISTRQIQRLLDTVSEKAGLQETKKRKVRQRKRITP